MKILWSTGYRENFWGDWLTAPQIGGSERLVVKMAGAMSAQGHQVSVRLPYRAAETVRRGVRYLSVDAPTHYPDILFCADDFQRMDRGARTILVACRSDPPPLVDFDQMVFLSATHARAMGHPRRPFVGGGVDLSDYAFPLRRVPRRVICTSSPDRCPQATAIGSAFDLVHTYRPVGQIGHEFGRAELVALQQTAMVQIYPLDPVRPSDFFSMSVLEAHAAGTPVVVSDADAMSELWADSAWVLPRPIDLGVWSEAVECLLRDRVKWEAHAHAGKAAARRYTWQRQASLLLRLALS